LSITISYLFTIYSTDGTESPILVEDGGDGHDKPRLRYGELVILG